MNNLMHKSRNLALLAVLLISPLSLEAGQESSPGAMSLEGATLRITFGLTDAEPTSWEGKIELSRGEVSEIRKDPPGKTGFQDATWKLRTRWKNPKKAPEKRTKADLIAPVLLATLAAADDVRVRVATNQGDFSFLLGDLRTGTPRTFLAERVRVERRPMSTRLTAAPTEDDLPSAAVSADGTVWVVYVAYTRGPPLEAKTIHETQDFDALVTSGNGDQVRLLRFDGKAWSDSIAVTETGLDVWRPSVAVDGEGTVRVVWSEYLDGDWDLYTRGLEPSTGVWSKRQRLTTAPGADVFVAAVTHPTTGKVHLAWQGWRGGSFDILHAVLDGSGSLRERCLFESAANEWCPSAAFDAGGALHVAFDTYAAGNYDVKLVSGAGGDRPRTIDVAASSLHEAHANVAVDNDGRVWVAHEEAAANWGKDEGLRWFGKKGEMLYVWREIRVSRIDGSRVLRAKGIVPTETVEAGYPRGSVEPKRRMSLPRIAFDAAGRLWLLYRRHPSSVGQGERWTTFATWHTGDGWSPAVELVDSLNLLDNRPALVPAAGGRLMAIHSTDGRTAGTQSAKQNDLYCALLDAPGEVRIPQLESPPEMPANVEAVHPDELGDVRRIREYRSTIGGKTYRLLRGEFHRHTELTSHQDMDGTLEEMWRYAIDVASMDWIGNGDHHNGYGVEYLWWMVQKQTDIFHQPGTFLPMFTYERSVSFPSGHRNALFARRGIRPLPNMPGGKEVLHGTFEEGAPDTKSFYAYLKHFDGICASHTSGTNMGTDWRDNDPDVEPVVEIFQGCRQSYEHRNAPATAKDAKDSIGGYRSAGYVWNALQRGYRLGFEASSDHYSTHISYAIVYAEEPTRQGILEAFKKRHCYAANDNIILDVRCGERMMGDVFDLKKKPTLTIRAIGTAPIARVSILRGVASDVPRYVYDASPEEKQIAFDWTDESPEWETVNYYYVRLEQKRPEGGAGALAWASPMWIHLRQ